MTQKSLHTWTKIFFISVLWVVALGLLATTALELTLRVRARWQEAGASPGTSRYDQLAAAYEPFTIQYLNPQYLFFFPREPAKRIALSNDVVRLTGEGFRGASPEDANGRQLAFIVGGSSAFGHYSSSDDTTITGYLNQLQTKYLFINAGVPSWNSTQELFRVAFQIMDYHPALVVAYDGANDAEIMHEYRQGAGLAYPPGTPESFDRLAGFFDDIRAEPLMPRQRLADRLFPEIKRRIDGYLGTDEPVTARPPVSQAAVDASAQRHLSSLQRMRDLVVSGGGRFVDVFQPIMQLHRNAKVRRSSQTNIPRFHDAFVRMDLRGLDFHDLSSVFDRHYATIPVLRGDVDKETIFVDEVHLFDRGNAIVAEEIWKVVSGPDVPVSTHQ